MEFRRVLFRSLPNNLFFVLGGTNGLSLENTKTRLLGKPMELPVSKEILGRIFSGAGRREMFYWIVARLRMESTF